MASLIGLLFQYAFVGLFNTLLSGYLYLVKKEKFYRPLFVMWVISLVGFLITGALNKTVYGSIIAFSLTFTLNFAFLYLISYLLNLTFEFKKRLISFLPVAGVAYGLSLFFYTKGMGFVYSAVPISFMVSIPFFVYLWQLLQNVRFRDLSFSAKGLIIAVALNYLHYLDFPYLRLNDTATVIAFSVALFLTIVLMVFSWSALLEKLSSEKAKIETEMNVAKRIQSEVIPNDPKISGLDMACYMRPADDVGGDYYDVIHTDQSSWIILGDVVGHGLGSGLIMFMIQSIMSTFLDNNTSATPADLNYYANRVLLRNMERLKDPRPVSLVALTTSDGRSFQLSGFHDNLYIFRQSTQDIEVVQIKSTPFNLGVSEFEKEAFSNQSFTLDKGDVILMCTDGITEAEAPTDSEQFQEARVLEILKQHGDKASTEIRNEIISSLDMFTGGTYTDDVTFIVAKAA